jgi:hypothetical protein
MNSTSVNREGWYDILVDDSLLVSIKGRRWAEHYLRAMRRGSQRQWKIVDHNQPEEVQVVRPSDVARGRRVSPGRDEGTIGL